MATAQLTESTTNGSALQGDLSRELNQRISRNSLGNKGGSRGLCPSFNPEESPLMKQWDLISAALLVLVAFMTPLEAGFLGCAEIGGPRFIINQLVNLFFVCDLILQFFLPYQALVGKSLVTIRVPFVIVKHYLRTWFLLDFVSVLPYELIAPCGEQSKGGVNLGFLRAVRMMRLLKLLKLLRGFRMFARWQLEFGISRRKTTLYVIICSVVIAAHWIASILGLLSKIQAGSREACASRDHAEAGGCVVTWLTNAAKWYDSTDSDASFAQFNTYLVALHASMSILVHPHSYAPTTVAERLALSILMLIGGFIWTQVISRTTAICTSLNQHQNSYQTTMDDLNQISDDFGLSHDMRRRLRKYFMNTQDESKREAWGAIVKKMSPKLRRDCCREVNKYWVMSIRFMSKCSIDLITDVAERMIVQCFSETEYFGEPFTLYIQMEGTAMLTRTGKVVAPGVVWGEDHLLLSCRELQLDNSATAMVFVQCEVLTKAAMDDVILDHPEQKEHFRRETVRLAVIRGIMWQAHLRKEAMRLSSSQNQPAPSIPLPPEALPDKPRIGGPIKPSPADEAHVPLAKPTALDDALETTGLPPKPKRADEPLREAALRGQISSDFSSQASASLPTRIGGSSSGSARASVLANGVEGAAVMHAAGGSNSLVEELAMRVEQLADQQTLLMEHIMALAFEVRSLKEGESHMATSESVNLTARAESDSRRAPGEPIFNEPGRPASV